MLEDKGAAAQLELGSKVVGGSLAAVDDLGARELFAAMAVAAEDVPVPMAALELIWCAKTGAGPPLSKLNFVRLRHHTFSLLDRSLLLLPGCGYHHRGAPRTSAAACSLAALGGSSWGLHAHKHRPALDLLHLCNAVAHVGGDRGWVAARRC